MLKTAITGKNVVFAGKTMTPKSAVKKLKMDRLLQGCVQIAERLIMQLVASVNIIHGVKRQ